jgi:hypothetical protein
MKVKLKESDTELNVKFYDGISLAEYEKINIRWNEILITAHEEVSNYINDDNLCFNDESDSFPMRNKLTGNYYIDYVSYIKTVNPVGFRIMISTRFTEFFKDEENDYLGLEVTIFIKNENDAFEVWGIDSSVI